MSKHIYIIRVRDDIDESMKELIHRQNEEYLAREEAKRKLNAERVKKYNATFREKMKQLNSYVDTLQDFVKKIELANNIDEAFDIYQEALRKYAEAQAFLDENKGMRKSASATQMQKLTDVILDLKQVLNEKKAHSANTRKDIDIITELVDLATNASNDRTGNNEARISQILNMINRDFDYKLLSERQLKDLKRTLNTVAPDIAKRIVDSKCQ